jgi:RluA family pseudouridine synthase
LYARTGLFTPPGTSACAASKIAWLRSSFMRREIVRDAAAAASAPRAPPILARRMAIPILHRDEHLIVVDKPAGLLSVRASGSDERALPDVLAGEGIVAQPVHRLDREVSGAILLALGEQARAAAEELFRERTIEKTYWALASGRVHPPAGKLHAPILEERGGARVSALGKPAVTRYRTIAAHASATELEIDLETGRRNQIRVHFAHAGFPLVGERKYARGKDSALRLRSRRVALHAWKLAFVHPITGERVSVEAPLPADLVELRERARTERRHGPAPPGRGRDRLR